MEYRYTAIVLRKKEVGETDRLYTLYTKEQGKIRVVARGVRKPEAKLAGQLENLSEVAVTVVKGRGTGKIAGALLENIFPHVRTDYEILRRVLQAVSWFERLVDVDEPDPELFQHLREYIALADGLAEEEKILEFRLLTQAFLFQVFARLGYQIETGVSALSGERLRAGERHFFSPKAGGMLTEAEAPLERQAFAIHEHTIKLLRLFLQNRLSACLRVKVDENDLRDLELVSKRHFQWILH